MSKTAESATHSLAITADGSVEATPRTASGNRFGQCGDGSAERRCEMRTRRVGGLTGVVAVAAGGGNDAGHSLAVTRQGDTYAWGCDRWQQLGLGSAEAGAVGYTWEGGKLWQTAPRRVEALRGIVDVAAGADHSLALARDGQVYAWGRGNDGQLGEGLRRAAAEPRRALGEQVSLAHCRRRAKRMLVRDLRRRFDWLRRCLRPRRRGAPRGAAGEGVFVVVTNLKYNYKLRKNREEEAKVREGSGGAAAAGDHGQSRRGAAGR